MDSHNRQSRTSNITPRSARSQLTIQKFQCRQCGECLNTKTDFLEHSNSHSSQSRTSRQSNGHQYRCRRAEYFDNRRDLYLHSLRQHYQVGGALQRRPWAEDAAPWNRERENDGLPEVYEANAPLILETHQKGPVQSVYNFPLNNDVNVNQLMRYADEIYRQEQRACRLNVAFWDHSAK